MMHALIEDFLGVPSTWCFIMKSIAMVGQGIRELVRGSIPLIARDPPSQDETNENNYEDLAVNEIG
jgi:hypothetical protein